MLLHFSVFVGQSEDIQLKDVTRQTGANRRAYLLEPARLNPNTAKLYLQKMNSIQKTPELILGFSLEGQVTISSVSRVSPDWQVSPGIGK